MSDPKHHTIASIVVDPRISLAAIAALVAYIVYGTWEARGIWAKFEALQHGQTRQQNEINRAEQRIDDHTTMFNGLKERAALMEQKLDHIKETTDGIRTDLRDAFGGKNKGAPQVNPHDR